MKNRCAYRLYLSVVLFVLCGGASGSELSALYAKYTQALESGDRSNTANAARAVYEFASENLPESSKSRVAASLNYGRSLLALEQHHVADGVIHKALVLSRGIYEENAIEHVDALMLLAQARAGNVGNSSRSRYRDFIDEALEIVEKNSGKHSFFYANTLLEGGRIGVDNAVDRYADRYLQAAYTAFRGPLSAHELERFLSGFYMGKYLLLRNRYQEAEAYLSEAVALADSSSKRDSQLELTARAFLVRVYEQMGLSEKSAEQCRLIGQATPFSADQEAKPLFSARLDYPRSALQRGAEGYAIAEFTITDTGVADDIRIVETKGSQGFGRSAEEYIERLRFAPRFENGEAVDTPSQKLRVNFNLVK
ncbi:energy transducer TonB [Microbulbifer sp. ARAS458-1]|uniref:energy transducer TonB n=1 Tax=Microbulbifer sp. ARAS458-1 TaxID=3140242 RepID=UPI003877CA39